MASTQEVWDHHVEGFVARDLSMVLEDYDEIFDITNDFENPENLFCMFDITGSGSFNAGGSASVGGVEVASGEVVRLRNSVTDEMDLDLLCIGIEVVEFVLG